MRRHNERRTQTNDHGEIIMEILMVVAYFITEIGSAEHIYFDLAKAFIKRGHEVDVITSYPRDFKIQYSVII
jgi:hypothetical protein